jgi:uncharacterized protein YcbK (DUF882 family)
MDDVKRQRSAATRSGRSNAKPTRPKYRLFRSRHRLLRADVASVLLVLAAVLGVVQFYRPEAALGKTPFRRFTSPDYMLGAASGNAFGRSGEVKLLFAMPGDKVEFPLAVGGDPTTLTYEWTSLRGNDNAFVAQPLNGAELETPLTPGFYQLTLIRGDDRQVVSEPALAVMRPFREKLGSMLNGYRIGTYLAERLRGEREHPEGFLEVYPQYQDIGVSQHLKLSYFITHDDQEEVWPKYIALQPRLLDKLELVIAELERMRGANVTDQLELDVHSGFRTPAHNKQVRRAARDSRHQYGDAADIVVDANGNGHIDRGDLRLVVAAVEAVEHEHPDLVGGLGLYTSRRYPQPYVHIDARGIRTRWRG